MTNEQKTIDEFFDRAIELGKRGAFSFPGYELRELEQLKSEFSALIKGCLPEKQNIDLMRKLGEHTHVRAVGYNLAIDEFTESLEKAGIIE